MDLTQAQKTTFKTHANANTNLATLPGGGTFTINTNLADRDPSKQQAIADWYNGLALAGDNQAFTNLMLWNPAMTIAQLNSAINWPDNPVGADATAINNSWMKWQSMTWAGSGGRSSVALDMTDAQVRQGVISVWGNPSTTLTNIGAVSGVLSGKIAGRRIELALSPVPVGAISGAWTGAHICPLNVLAQILSQSNVDDALLNG